MSKFKQPLWIDLPSGSVLTGPPLSNNALAAIAVGAIIIAIYFLV
jgi:hypothetical protein